MHSTLRICAFNNASFNNLRTDQSYSSILLPNTVQTVFCK